MLILHFRGGQCSWWERTLIVISEIHLLLGKRGGGHECRWNWNQPSGWVRKWIGEMSDEGLGFLVDTNVYLLIADIEWPLSHIISFKSHSKHRKQVILLSPFYRWWNWGTQRSRNLSKITDFANGKVKIWIQGVWLQRPLLSQ